VKTSWWLPARLSRSLTSALIETVLKGAFKAWVRSISGVNKLAI
jgi:hypothetical protein